MSMTIGAVAWATTTNWPVWVGTRNSGTEARGSATLLAPLVLAAPRGAGDQLRVQTRDRLAAAVAGRLGDPGPRSPSVRPRSKCQAKRRAARPGPGIAA